MLKCALENCFDDMTCQNWLKISRFCSVYGFDFSCFGLKISLAGLSVTQFFDV
jgi:hypothetical protein